MKKIIVDRLNYLKSDLRQLTKVKLDKRDIDENKVISLLARIDELQRLLKKYLELHNK
jgi:hypothetical protein